MEREQSDRERKWNERAQFENVLDIVMAVSKMKNVLAIVMAFSRMLNVC